MTTVFNPKAIPMRSAFCLFVFFVSFVVPASAGDVPCVSGVPTGERPKPYTFHVATGPQRGQGLTCYICETADKPAVIVFARTMTDPLGKLLQGLDKAIVDNKASELRAWTTFLTEDPLKIDPQLVEWGKKQALVNVPLGAFAGIDGPPTYKLAREADVTVLLFVKQKVVANFAFRSGELSEAKIADIIKGVPQLLGK
jgi:hypothetical protein